jgi:hypothetical protein
MHLTVINPLGKATSIDLDGLPSWALELRVMPVPGAETKGLALGIAYSVAGVQGFSAIVCLNCRVTGSDLESIVLVGLPRPDRSGNKERLREALKVLVNSFPNTKEVDEILAKSARLVDAYHDIVEVLWNRPHTPLIPDPPPVASGELDSWRWALTRGRFQQWIGQVPTDTSVVVGLGAVPAVKAPVDVNTLPPAAPMSMAPPPSAAPKAGAGASTSTDDDLGPGDILGPAPGQEKIRGKGKK